MTLHVPTFVGGVVLEGGAESRGINELLEADSLEIDRRGPLVAASDRSDYTTLLDLSAAPWSRLYGILSMAIPGAVQSIAIGEGIGPSFNLEYIMNFFARSGAASTTPFAPDGANFFQFTPPFLPFTPSGNGVIVTGVTFPGVFDVATAVPPEQVTVSLVCLGAREGATPRSAPGLHVLMANPPGVEVVAYPIGMFEALGTGVLSADYPGGTEAKHLFPRGILGYNNHVLAYGFDEADTANGEGPNRVMFCNLGKPIKWGNDNQGAAGTDRAFTDSDAIVLGDQGEIIRSGRAWAGRAWFGTDRGLHFIGGYGRDSFLTDGAQPIARSYNVVGPNLIEGPDKLLYGVGDQGLWGFDGSTFAPHFRKLVDFSGRSSGYWDLIWTDPTASAAAYPGRTNQDLVWTAADYERRQVLVGIPFCSASAGYGSGLDTVVLKLHVDNGGFTRQVFSNVALTAAGYFRREGQMPDTRFLGTATAGEVTVERYGHRSSATTPPVMPERLPVAEFGWYSPFGADGAGVIRRGYLTLAWEDADALPLVFAVTTTIDQNTVDSFALTVGPDAPGSPAQGDLWLDTSESDPSIGNGSSTGTVPARGGYLLKTYSAGALEWSVVPGQGGSGTRATMQLPLTRVTGTRVTVRARCVAAAGRFQWEGLGLNPGGGTAAA